MFRCQKCGVNVGPKVQERRIIVETRQKIYPERTGKFNKYWDEEEERFRYKGDPGGFGWERVRELKVCERCETMHQAKR